MPYWLLQKWNSTAFNSSSDTSASDKAAESDWPLIWGGAIKWGGGGWNESLTWAAY